MAEKAFGFGLLRRREMVLPSLRGCLVLATFLVGGGYALLITIHPFLSPNRPVGGQVLVVEGWIPEYSQREALAVFRSGGYRILVTTGGPLPPGMPYSSFGTHAALAASVLRGMGLDSDSVVAVPSLYTEKDRTYMEGVALQDWMRSGGHAYRSLDLFTFSAHGRRSLYLYRKAFGRDFRIGVYSARDIGYDPAVWWKSSDGVRKVLDEAIAYAYAILLFKP